MRFLLLRRRRFGFGHGCFQPGQAGLHILLGHVRGRQRRSLQHHLDHQITLRRDLPGGRRLRIDLQRGGGPGQAVLPCQLVVAVAAHQVNLIPRPGHRHIKQPFEFRDILLLAAEVDQLVQKRLGFAVAVLRIADLQRQPQVRIEAQLAQVVARRLLQVGAEDHREFQPLGLVDGHNLDRAFILQRDLRLPFPGIQVDGAVEHLDKIRQRHEAALLVIPGHLYDLIQVGQQLLPVPFRRHRGPVEALFENFVEQRGEGEAVAPLLPAG